MAAQLQDVLRAPAIQTVSLGKHPVPAVPLMPLAEGADVVTPALILHRTGKSTDVLALLTDQTDVRAELFSPWLNMRGRSAETARALAKAGVPDASLPWDERLPLEMLRHEAEGLVKSK